MKICLVAEGSYPYIQGGVSSWINALVSQMPEHEFVIQTIAASRSDSGKFKYKLPENITAVNEAFLQDNDILRKKVKRLTMTPDEYAAFRSLMFADDEKWEYIFDFFQASDVSINEVIMGKDFFDIVWEYYNVNYPRVVFTDFLWTFRSVFLPLFTVLKNKLVRADVYHTVSTGYAGILASCASYLYKKPLLLTEHGIYTREREEEIIRAAWTRGIYKDIWINHFYMLSHCIYQRADRVFSIFDYARDLQIEIGCPAEKTEVIRNGVKYDAFQNLVQKDPDDKHINVGAVIRVTPIKDVKTMITAFHHAKEKVPELVLYIIGNTEEDPYYYNECVELVESLGTEDIIFTGHVNVRDYIGKMDIAILTSISEGQPLSLLEAMAAGIPCIATRVGDCYTMFNAGDEEGRAGIIASVMNVGQIANAIVELAQDEDLRHKMGRNGRDIVDKSYRDTTFINRYKEVYTEVYEQRSNNS